MGLPCNALLFGLSYVGWRWKDAIAAVVTQKPDAETEDKLRVARATMDPTAFTSIVTIMCVTGLPMFTGVQFVAIHGVGAWRKSGLRYAVPIMSVLVSAFLWGLWASGWPFWYYYMDVLSVVVTYSVGTFLAGYYGDRTLKSRRGRIKDGLEFCVIECLVAAAAIIYAVWLMPIYSSLDENFKVAWRMTIHPLYWESMIKIGTRRLLMLKAGPRLSAADTLTMAHAQLHLIIMQASMVAALSTLQEMCVTLLLIHSGRLFWRSTCLLREIQFVRLWNRIVKGRWEDAEEVYIDTMRYLLAIEIQSMGVMLAVHYVYIMLNTYLSGTGSDLFTTISLHAVILPLTLIMLYISFSSNPPTHPLKQGVICLNGFAYALLVAIRVISCKIMYAGGCPINVQLTQSPLILYGMLGPIFMLMVYKVNRGWCLGFAAVFMACFSYVIATGNVMRPWTSITFLFGFFVWTTLISYWNERVERENYRLRYQLKEQVQATRIAQGGEIREAASKRRFVSYIFHEIRVPFNTAVLGFHNMEADGLFSNLTESQFAVFEATKASFAMMEAVLNDVLDFQKMEEGKFELQARPFDVNTTVKSVAASLQSTANEKAISILVTPDSRIDQCGGKFLLGDDIRFRQILNNYLSNACKFTPRNGTVQITTKLVEAGHEEAPEDLQVPWEPPKERPTSITVRTSVKDSGLGIAADDIKRMFQPYTQINSWATQDGKGTGLGLAICKHIVQLAGGTCGVESNVGEGSTFWFEITFPVASVTVPSGPDAGVNVPRTASRTSLASAVPSVAQIGSPVHSSLPPIPGETGSGSSTPTDVPLNRSLRVLIVDDCRITRQVNSDKPMMMSRMLGTMGHTFEVAEDGMAAVERVTGAPVVPGSVHGADTGGDGKAGAIKPNVSTTPLPAVSDPLIGSRHRRDPTPDVVELPVTSVGHPLSASLCEETMAGHPTRRMSNSEQEEVPKANGVAPTAVEAETAPSRPEFDVILMDNHMPRLTGEEAVAELRARGFTLPVIGITGNALKEDQDSFMAAGANLVITKPLAKDKLVNALRLIP
ncbi:HisKA [Borealophlyctis nickersoniae]|nr:HisKA [Borealophlyctis nickersoniae]